MRQDLLNDHRAFNAGNDPGCFSEDSTRLNVDIETPLQPLRPGHGRMTLNWRLLILEQFRGQFTYLNQSASVVRPPLSARLNRIQLTP